MCSILNIIFLSFSNQQTVSDSAAIIVRTKYKTDFHYIQINEIQDYIDEITGIFHEVLFSVLKNIKSVISLVKNINFWMTFAFFHKFPL